MRPALPLALALLSSCTGSGPLGGHDLRIDAKSEGVEVDSDGPRLCVTEGRVYVAWSDARDGLPGIWLNRSTDGGTTWLEDPVRVDQGAGAADAPELRCQGGVVHVVWQDTRDGEVEHPNIYYNRSTDAGESWRDVDILLTDDPEGTGASLGPQIAGYDDELAVTWFDGRNGAFDIYFAGSSDGGLTWREPLRLDSGAAGQSYSAWPRLTTTRQGHVYVVWEDSRDGASDIYFASSSDHGHTFAADQRLDRGDEPGAHDSFAPRIHSRGGHVYAVWHDSRNGPYRDIYMNWSTNHGLNWATSAERVDTGDPGTQDSLHPDVVVHIPGEGPVTTHIAWQDARATAYDPFLRVAEEGTFGAPEQPVSTHTPGAANSLYPRILREGRTLVVVWEDRRADPGDGHNDLYYNYSLDGGVTWGARELRLDSTRAGSSRAVEFDVALDEGVLHATWVDDRRGTRDVYFQALAVGDGASTSRD